jgi:hypothetical protein
MEHIRSELYLPIVLALQLNPPTLGFLTVPPVPKKRTDPISMLQSVL